MAERIRIDWVERTKRRHELCLSWHSEGAVALAVSAPPRLGRDWTRWFQDPQVMLDHELALLENKLAVQSDIVPTVFTNFTAAVVVSMLGARIEFHENGPVYEPLIRDWRQLDDLGMPDMDSGLMPRIEQTLAHFRRHVPDVVEVVPPYIHTPLNSAALLRGPLDFYADLCLERARAHQLLKLVTDTAAAVAGHIFDHLGRPPTPFVNQTGIFLGDMVHISDDCCVNLSPEFIREFDLAYVEDLAAQLSTRFCTHYCAMPPRDLAEHCLAPICACGVTAALYNQYSPEYFLEHYDQFENRLALVSLGLPAGARSGRTPDERLRNFRDWSTSFLERFEGKSGLIIQCMATTVEEAREVYRVWESLCPWQE